MRRRARGFLMVELTAAIAIFCGVLLVLVLALGKAGELTASDVERTNAASRLGEVLDEIRSGAVPVRDGKSVEVSPDASRTSLRDEKCTVTVEPWSDALRKVNVMVKWRSLHGHERSVAAVTLVRTKRLKFEGAAP